MWLIGFVSLDRGGAGRNYEPRTAPDASRRSPGVRGGSKTSVALRNSRTTQKPNLGEPYRTLLGHFRHEIGHYYWTRLVDDTRKKPYRGIFGDERADYAKALERHYREGAPADWQDHFVSAYASAHPWEDWAETWAHYVHMTDTLETAIECGLSLRPSRADEPSLKRDRSNPVRTPFDRMIDDWFSVTYLMNNLNRGLGLPDAYPFVLAPPSIETLRFVHETIVAVAG